jgi:hypothetical protein
VVLPRSMPMDAMCIADDPPDVKCRAIVLGGGPSH